jgi:hypothetical protein
MTVTVLVGGLAGVLADPAHVIVYPESVQARQQHVTLLHARSRCGSGDPAPT